MSPGAQKCYTEFMINLDDPSIYTDSDVLKVLESTNKFSSQCIQALSETQKLDILVPSSIKNVIVAGMGGSGFSADIIKTCFCDKLRLPLEIVNDYSLPGYVSKDTLLISSSYSGNTEETIEAVTEALGKQATVLALTTGGKLKDMVMNKQINGYVFEAGANPAGQPRMATGYMLSGLYGLLVKANILPDEFEIFLAKASKLSENNQFDTSVDLVNNPAKKLAEDLYGKFVILATSGFLQGAIHGFANSLNETAKTNSSFHFIPELDHHRLEGLQYPADFKKMTAVVFYQSALFTEKIKLRFKLTEDVVNQNGFKTIMVDILQADKFSGLLYTINLNQFTAFYLSRLYQVNPIKIPWVDYFKNKLSNVIANEVKQSPARLPRSPR